MNIKSIRDFVLTKVKEVAPSGTIVYAAGDVSKPDLLDVRARVKVMPSETRKIGLGLSGYKEGGGLVQIDLFQAQVNGYESLEEIGQDIVRNIPLVTYEVDNTTTLHVWAVWVDQIIDESPYFHIPVFLRWTTIHT